MKRKIIAGYTLLATLLLPCTLFSNNNASLSIVEDRVNSDEKSIVVYPNKGNTGYQFLVDWGIPTTRENILKLADWNFPKGRKDKRVIDRGGNNIILIISVSTPRNPKPFVVWKEERLSTDAPTFAVEETAPTPIGDRSPDQSVGKEEFLEQEQNVQKTVPTVLGLTAYDSAFLVISDKKQPAVLCGSGSSVPASRDLCLQSLQAETIPNECEKNVPVARVTPRAENEDNNCDIAVTKKSPEEIQELLSSFWNPCPTEHDICEEAPTSSWISSLFPGSEFLWMKGPLATTYPSSIALAPRFATADYSHLSDEILADAAPIDSKNSQSLSGVQKNKSETAKKSLKKDTMDYVRSKTGFKVTYDLKNIELKRSVEEESVYSMSALMKIAEDARKQKQEVEALQAKKDKKKNNKKKISKNANTESGIAKKSEPEPDTLSQASAGSFSDPYAPTVDPTGIKGRPNFLREGAKLDANLEVPPKADEALKEVQLKKKQAILMDRLFLVGTIVLGTIFSVCVVHLVRNYRRKQSLTFSESFS